MGEAAGGDDRGLTFDLLSKPRDDPVHLARVAEDDTRLDRLAGTAADGVVGRVEVDPWQLGGALGEGD